MCTQGFLFGINHRQADFEIFPQAAALSQEEKTSFDYGLAPPSPFLCASFRPGSTFTPDRAGIANPALSGVLNLNRRKSRKLLFHVPIFETSIKENCLGELGIRIKTPKVSNLVAHLDSAGIAHPTNIFHFFN
jgi:hypothetical protein